MHDKPNPGPEPVDSVILGLLIHDDACGPWSVEEVVREVGDEDDTADGLARLAGAGLIHRLDRFTWASRAALRAEQIAA
jgi:hypothetical protein